VCLRWTMPDDDADFRQCLVCQTPVRTLHLGMDVCRACASFFKRAKSIGAEYPCRQGTGKCSVAKDGRFMCRRCRFDRCVKVGLEYDGQMKCRRPSAGNSLRRVGKEYRALIDRRKRRELKLLRTCGVRLPHPRDELYYINVPASVNVLSIAVEEAVQFYEKAFPSLKQLAKNEWEMIFKEFVAKLTLISGYYCGRKLWGSSRTKVMSSVVTCYDREKPFEFYYPDVKENKGAFKSSLRSHADDHNAIFKPIFDRANITETEFHALAALILTEHDLQISEKALQQIDTIRHGIFNNLQAYYREELALTDYSTRLGNLMSLNHAVQESCAIFKVFFGFYSTIFDSFMVNRSMETLLLGS
ncbi:hypothetical protein PMAYCL1PPCAC_16718, partial [Pristionchus mayeri]